VLIGNTHFDVGNLVVIVYLGGLGGEHITNFGTVEEHDIVLNTKGEGLTAVHDGSDGDIGQGKINTTLTDASGIEVLRGNGQFGSGEALAYFYKFAATIGSKAVIL